MSADNPNYAKSLVTANFRWLFDVVTFLFIRRIGKSMIVLCFAFEFCF